MRGPRLNRIALTAAALLAALSVVAWRQGRSFTVLDDLDEVRSEIGLARSQRAELHRDIRVLESRSRIVEDAARRLGLQLPEGQVQVLHLETQ